MEESLDIEQGRLKAKFVAKNVLEAFLELELGVKQVGQAGHLALVEQGRVRLILAAVFS